MRTREAIELLKNMKWSITTKFNAVNNSTKALDMAIAALEKQEQTIKFIESRKQLHSSPAWYEFGIVKELDEVKRFIEKMQAEEKES